MSPSHTSYGYRINSLKEAKGPSWIFLPGGPGLGSEYLYDFANKLDLPGSKILADFPKDGTNHKGKLDINYWREGLVDLVKNIEKPILVTHSFSGMLSLTVPELGNILSGLVLMNTTHYNSFLSHVTAMRDWHHFPDLAEHIAAYMQNPTQEGYQKYWETYKNYCFTKDEMAVGEEMIKLFANNVDSYNMAGATFYPDYKSNWVPTMIPTLTIAGELDATCPGDAFIKDACYQHPMIMNCVIKQAGHMCWTNHFNEVQDCFDQFLPKLL